MQCSQWTKSMNTLCVIFVILAGCVRLLMTSLNYTYNALILILFIFAAMIWKSQLQRRLLQTQVRRNLVIVVYFMIFWMAIRTIKYEFTSSHDIIARYIWYIYYVPLILIPLLMFLSVLYIGKPYEQTIDKRWNLLYIPAIFLIIGILTNDYHQLAFYFLGSLSHWNDYSYLYGPLYYSCVLWIVVLAIMILIHVFRKCTVFKNRKKIWIPLIPLVIGLLHCICIITNQFNLFTHFLSVPEMGYFIFASFMECLIDIHLFPSNDSYGLLWNASSIGAGIMDKNHVIRYQSQQSRSVTPNQVINALTEVIFLQKDKFILKSHEIHGGYGYWMRDVSEIIRLNQELEDIGNVLEEENSMLLAENDIAEKRIHIQQQNKIYDQIAHDIAPQLDKIAMILDSLPTDENEFEKMMKYNCILNVYIKRRSNLFLLFYQNREIHSDELIHAFCESLEYIRLYGITANGTYHGKSLLDGKKALVTYELFENIIEKSLFQINAILVYLDILDHMLTLRVTLDSQEEIIHQDLFQKQMDRYHGKLEIIRDETTEYISFRI